MLERIVKYSMDKPYVILVVILALSIVFVLQFPKIHIDTDPENMLEPDQPDRVFYDRVKDEFGINDLLVVGIVDDGGVFTPESLEKIKTSIDEISKIDGVIIADIISLTTTDNVKSVGGFLEIRPVMGDIPQTEEAIQSLRNDIAENPFLHEKIASDDGTAVAIYIPIEQKNQSYRIAGEIREVLDNNLLSGQEYHLAGLPVAEDTFGHEMFIQMGIVAPIAFIVILLLVAFLFRQTAFLLPLGLHAMLAVIWSMGLLIGTGNIVHIMSSMIPVFLMPIAILDDVHVLSEFFDKYRKIGDKRQALIEALRPLYKPMLFTSLTSGIGFASLMLADIPPVRLFGLFVGFGIMVAWVMTITMLPAMISLMNDEKLKSGLVSTGNISDRWIDSSLRSIGRVAFNKASAVLAAAVIATILGIVGVSRININDNPVKWFKPGHEMRIADTVMNKLFGGTYMVYLVVEGDGEGAMKNPEVVNYIDSMQKELESNPLVGKTSSIADIVRRINFVLHDNDPAWDIVPDSSDAVGQFLFLFQSSGDPNDLDNFIDLDSTKANIWIQMKGGDNRMMHGVENQVSAFIAANPPPDGILVTWSGLTYINMVWQTLMVSGMLKAVFSSFIVVFFLMMIGFRSVSLAALSMAPLTVGILLSYGLAGWLGKDYDMPIAVCSSLALGLSIDFAIHFISRYRTRFEISHDTKDTSEYMFNEPGRAITRNAIVIAFGFLPLVASTLTPYITVGVFFAILMIASTLTTLFILPSALKFIAPRVIRGGSK
ncbi:MAG TPA: MMPL family transporter [bacterium]|jgi:hypothetical protein